MLINLPNTLMDIFNAIYFFYLIFFVLTVLKLRLSAQTETSSAGEHPTILRFCVKFQININFIFFVLQNGQELVSKERLLLFVVALFFLYRNRFGTLFCF